jgi:hypothetical protein
MARVPGTAHGARLHRRDTANCPRIPALLAARAGGLLGDADEERLSRHLAHCERCRAVEAAFARAERAYHAPRAQALAPATESFLVAALGAAAPIVATAQDPEPGNRSQPAALPLTAGVQDADDHDEPAPSVAAGTADDTLGETMEWDALPAIPARPAPRVAHAGSVLEGGRERSARGGGGGRVLRLVLPVIVVLAGGVGALVVAGVFGGNDPAPPVQRDTSSRDLERPVTTPLPVEVRTTATPQDGLVTAPLQP